MANNTQNKDQRKSGAYKNTDKATSTHKLNVPMKNSDMSKSDKATLRAWEYTYRNRDKRVD